MNRYIFFTLLLLTHFPLASAIDNNNTIDNLLASGEYDQAVKYSAQTDHYLAVLLQKSRELNLADDPTWQTLLHYKKGIFNGYESQIDGSIYFHSKNGKYNPQAELEATLASFFSLKEYSKRIPLSSQCLYVARYYWLNKKIDFDKQKLPEHSCSHFKTYEKSLNAESISVIFPTAFGNSPASMFGHTLLRINKEGQTEQTKMLAFSINYAATVDTDNNFLYFVKGFTGGFRGHFSVIPYYSKLREYSEMENRDIWEYKLNLSKEMVDFIIMHSYELEKTYLDYYYFSENCSYHLLSLIEVGLHGNSFTQEAKSWVIPLDTIKILDNKAMIDSYRYEPSQRTKLQHLIKDLNSKEKKLVFNIFKNGLTQNYVELDTFDINKKALLLDIAYEYVRYRKIEKASEVRVELSNREREILIARSKLRVKSLPVVVPQPKASPHKGHDTMRLIAGFGTTADNEYSTLQWRGAYHNLLDPSAGYIDYYHIEFFNLTANYYHTQETFRFERLEAISVMSLPPRTDFSKEFSWHFSTGIQNTDNINKDYFALPYLKGGTGLSYQLGNSHGNYLYMFADGGIESLVDLQENYSIYGGYRIGMLTKPLSNWKVHLFKTSHRTLSGDKRDKESLTIEQNIAISRNLSLKLSWEETILNQTAPTQNASITLAYYH